MSWEANTGIFGFDSAMWGCHGDCFHRSLAKMASAVGLQLTGHTTLLVAHSRDVYSEPSKLSTCIVNMLTVEDMEHIQPFKMTHIYFINSSFCGMYEENDQTR